MKITSHFLGHDTAPVDNTMSVISFLHGPIVTHLAAAGAPEDEFGNGLEPEEILLDYLPQDLESLDDEELSQVFKEACVMVLSVSPYEYVAFRTVDRVQVEPEDIPELKHIFGIGQVSSWAHPDGKVTMPLMVAAGA